MKSVTTVARVGAAAFALGLSLAGPQGAGTAAADAGSEDSAQASTAQTPGGAETASHPDATAGRPDRAGRTPTVGGSARAVRSTARSAGSSDGAAVPGPEPTRPARDSARQPKVHPSPRTTAARPAAVTSPAEGAGGAPAGLVESAVATQAPAVTVATPVAPSPRPAAAPRTPVEAALNAVTKALAVFSGALSGHHPATPVGGPLSWALLAAASRETFAPAAATEPVTATTTTATRTTSVPLTKVQIPLVTALKLQQIPVLGPLLVNPVVSFFNAIPMVGDILHPIFGYPVLPEGDAAPRDVRMTSFDGTEIAVHLMPAAGLKAGQSAPTVLMGPGLGQAGATNINGTPFDGILAALNGQASVATLRNAGYNVVTWDPRGEYASDGVFQANSPDYEARDVVTLIDWVAAQPEAQLNGAGDPKLGMVGPSYGGAIQLVTASIDHRIDAIVPAITWNTLLNSMLKNGAFKPGVAAALGVALMGTLTNTNPQIISSGIYGMLTGTMTPADQEFVAKIGPGSVLGYPDLVSKITAPTLILQGTADPLFSLFESDANAKTLLAQGVPTKVVWFCGGHGLCLNNPFDMSQGPFLQQQTVNWLDRYVKGEAVSTGPAFEWVDQRGQRFASDTYSASGSQQIVLSRSAGDTLALVPFVGGSGPILFVVPIGGTKALNAVNLKTPASTTTTYVVGEPKLTMAYSGTGSGSHVYAQVVDDATGIVLGNQVTPIPVTLDGQTHTIDIPLQPVVATLKPGETVTVQLFSWSADYSANRSLGSLSVKDLQVSLPTANPSAA